MLTDTIPPGGTPTAASGGVPVPASSFYPQPPHASAARRKGGFAGFTWGQLAMGSVLLAAAIWGAWITREVMALRGKRIVSVSLAAMANDFVMSEARAGASAERIEADTRHYMAALQQVLRDRADRGEILLVGEAVVSSSVPDLTPDIRAAVGRLITANPLPQARTSAPIAPPAALPPVAGVPIGAAGPAPNAQVVPASPTFPPAGDMEGGNGVAGQ